MVRAGQTTSCSDFTAARAKETIVRLHPANGWQALAIAWLEATNVQSDLAMPRLKPTIARKSSAIVSLTVTYDDSGQKSHAYMCSSGLFLNQNSFGKMSLRRTLSFSMTVSSFLRVR